MRELRKENIKNICGMTPMQEAMMYRKLVEKDSNAYFEQITFTIGGGVDVEAFCRAWNIIASRHDILRTAFVFENTAKPLQIVLKERDLDFYVCKEICEQKEIEIYKENDKKRGFDFKSEPLMRFAIFRISNDEHRIVWSFHHIIMDGWCNKILFEELERFYNSLIQRKTITLPPPPQFSSYVKWLNAQSPVKAAEYWKNYLRDYDSIASFPKNQAVGKKYNLSKHIFTVSRELTSQLKQTAIESSSTLSNLIKTAWGILLSRFCDKDDVVFGSTVSGRQAPVYGIQEMVGLFINTVPQRIKYGEETQFSEALLKAQNEALAQAEYDYFSLAEIQSFTELKENLFDNILIFENYVENNSTKLESNLEFYDFEDFEQTDYGMSAYISFGDTIRFCLKYNSCEYSQKTIQQIEFGALRILQAACKNPDVVINDIVVFTLEQATIVSSHYESVLNLHPTERNIPAIFKRQVELNPNKACLIFKGKEYSYAQMDRMSDAIAHSLINCGAGSKEIVAILLRRSELLVASMLGALKAGCAYLPLAPDSPKSRNEYILNSSRAKALLCDSKRTQEVKEYYNSELIEVDTLDMKESPSLPVIEIKEDDPAYLLFTSGSTGKPKGILNKHSSVVGFLPNMRDVFGFDGDTRFYAVTTITFDISILEILCNLLTGSTVVLSSDEAEYDPATFKEEIISNNANALQSTPSRLNSLIDALGIDFLKSIKTMLIGGEAFPAALGNKLSVLKGAKVFNVYGPTETTIWSTYKLVESGEVNIGKPLIGERVYILDRLKRPTPSGAIGEIYIGGTGTALGYWDNEGLTGNAFVDDLAASGDKMFKTGDYGSLNENNEINFHGRKDFQVKIRGFRIELREIERALESYPGVSRAVVLDRADENMESYLVAYIQASHNIDTADVMRFISKELPDYMLPANITALESLPVTPNGKIDRKALLGNSVMTVKQIEVPINETQLRIFSIWKEVLCSDGFGVNQSFVSLGGHSLKAVRMISQFNKEFSSNITLANFFREPTIKGLEKALNNGLIGETAEISRVPYKEYYELSRSQKRLWTVCLDPIASAAYNMPVAYSLFGEIDVEILEKSINSIVAEHEILRTQFVLVGDQPKQQVLPRLEVKIERVSLSVEKIEKEIAHRSRRAFVLDSAPLFEITLFRIGPRHNILFFNIHHIISDAQSQEILFKELEKRYQLLKNDLPLPSGVGELRFIDYAENENLRNSKANPDDRAYWLEKFRELPAPAELPMRRKRKPIRTYEGKFSVTTVSKDSILRVNGILGELGVTPFSFYSGLLQLLLHKYTAQRDITLGTVFSGRDNASLQSVMGFFAKTVAIRFSVEPNEKLSQFLLKAQKNIHEDFSRQGYNYDELLKELAIPADSGRNPLFDYMVVYQKEQATSTALGGARFEEYRIDFDYSRFDLSFHFIETDELRIELNYNVDLFDPAVIDTVKNSLKSFIERFDGLIDKRISDISLFSDITDKKDASFVQNTDTNGELNTIHGLFSRIAADYKNAIALITENGEWTYGQLDEESTRLAGFLIGKYGIQPGERIGVCFERGHDWIISLLGIFKAGAVYVPLDPKNPNARNEGILESATIKRIISTTATFHGFDIIDITNALTGSPILREAFENPKAPAYIIFTSGSTGKPKGVELNHEGLVNMALSQIEGFGIKSSDRVMQFASPAFDASLSEVFMAFFSGAVLTIIGDPKKTDPEEFSRFVSKYGITAATVPPALQPFLNADQLSSLRVLISAGESPNRDSAKNFSNLLEFYNAYGPTETSVCASFHRVTPADPEKEFIPIGKPIRGCRIYILNDNLEVLPRGFSGEICIGGIGLANGYINDEELTSQKFVHVVSLNDKLYRTGDIGKIDSDSNLIFIGRKDSQLKIRGFRVEPEEIKAVAEEIFGVSKSEIAIVERPHGLEIRCYYLSERVGPEDLLNQLKRKLPGYMVPSFCIKLDKFPMTSNGKVDFSALRAIEPEIRAPGPKVINRFEAAILSVFQEVLKRENVEANESFFDLGGDSISAIALSKKIAERTGRKIGVNDIYFYKTVRDIAIRIEQNENSSPVKAFNVGAPFRAFAFPSVLGLAEEYVHLAAEMQDTELHCFEFDDETARYDAEKIAELAGGEEPVIIGYSLGSALAFAAASALEKTGRRVKRLCLIDPPALDKDFFKRSEANVNALAKIYSNGYDSEQEQQLRSKMLGYVDYLEKSFHPEKVSTQIHIILSGNNERDNAKNYWQNLCDRELIFSAGEGDHLEMLAPPIVAQNAEIIKNILVYK